MPKTVNPRTQPKTSPGISYTIPSAKLVDSVILDDCHTYVIALDNVEEAGLHGAACELVQASVPGYRGDIDLPVITWKGRTCLRVSGQFQPTVRGPDGKPRKTVRAGATVTVRAMLKCWPTAEGVTVYAFPSRIDVHGRTPARTTTKAAEPAQLDLTLVPPAEPVAEPAPIGRKTRKTTKPATRKPTAKTQAVALPHGLTKAAYAAERAVIVRTRLQAQAAMEAQDPKPVRKSKAKAAAPLPENVILFPVERTRRPS